MDRQITPNRSRQWAKAGKWLGAVALAVLCLWGINRLMAPSLERSQIRSAMVERGSVAATINASGVVEPLQAQQLSSPLTSRIMAVHVMAGDEVKAGQPLVTLDDTQVAASLSKLRDELALKQVAKKALALNQKKQLRQLKSEQDLLEVDLASHQVKLQRYQVLFKNHTVSALDVNGAELAVKKAQIQLKQLGEQMEDVKQQTITDIERNALEQQILSQQIAQQQQLLDRSVVKAPADGIVTRVNDQLGQSVSQGEMVAIIADLSRYRVKGTLSDMYLSRLAPGQSVAVTVAGKPLKGSITQVLPAVDNGAMSFLIALDNPAAGGLRPQMQVELEVETARVNDSLRIRNGTAFNGGKSQQVYVIRDGIAERRQVSVGMSSTHYVQLLDGVKEGEEVILTDLRDLRHLDQIQIQ